MKLSQNRLFKIIRTVHILNGSCWFGGLLCMAAVLVMPVSGADEARVDLFLFIDAWVVIPSAIVACLSGVSMIIMSEGRKKTFFTPWIIVKTLLSSIIIIGGFLLVKTFRISDIFVFLFPNVDKVFSESQLYFPLTILAVGILGLIFLISSIPPLGKPLTQPKIAES